MGSLPQNVLSAWADREGPIVFATVDRKGMPNAIYATCVNLHGDDRIVIADNYMVKTLQNIRSGSPGTVLFLTRDKKSFQIKGGLEYLSSGKIFDEMKGWNPVKHPGRAAVVVRVEEVYSGGERLL